MQETGETAPVLTMVSHAPQLLLLECCAEPPGHQLPLGQGVHVLDTLVVLEK
jgi:hypothetical protein